MQPLWIRAATLRVTALLTLASPSLAADTVKVFVLAGQSNMEGKAQNTLLEHQATDAGTAGLFEHLRDGDGWVVRDDVFVKFLERKGGLTIGYGSPGRTGMELEFGWRLGERFEEPVVLVKAAWGGHSLYEPFRPPSAGLPGEEVLAGELAKRREQVERRNAKEDREDPLPTMEELVAGYGRSYRAMLHEVRMTMDCLSDLFPELAGKTPELAGFVWFQGWNDQYDGAEREYEANMKHFIADVRRDLGAPALPFVIAVMGQNMSQPAKGAMKTIQDAQLAMEQVPEFRGNVKAVRTDVLVDAAAESLYPEWKERREEWEKTGSDHPYHYLGSAIWYGRIGDACAEAMLELIAGRGDRER